jgi:hypothetical protein
MIASEMLEEEAKAIDWSSNGQILCVGTIDNTLY